jgi:hypothetical protein
VISELEMIPHAQFIAIFVINILAKFHELSYMKIAPFAAYYIFNTPNLEITSFKFGV